MGLTHKVVLPKGAPLRRALAPKYLTGSKAS